MGEVKFYHNWFILRYDYIWLDIVRSNYGSYFFLIYNSLIIYKKKWTIMDI